MAETYHAHLPDLTIPRFTEMAKHDAHSYAKEFIESGNPPWLHGLFLHWRKLFQEPFKGITNDGGPVRPGLFTLQDEGIPIEQIVDATQHLISLLSPTQKECLTKYHIDSPEWRTWSNPEFLLSDKGLRLDEVSSEIRDGILNILKQSLSPEGYEKALGAMRINGFLGELVDAPRVCNEFSYNFVLFGGGLPCTEKPWGFSFYGHHLCLNLFFYKRQVVVSPLFTGAEPNMIDKGKYKGTRILQREEKLGLELMRSLEDEKRGKAQIYKFLQPGPESDMNKKGRWNHDDQRHLCGAYRDNRVVPYEGVLVERFTEEQKKLVRGILNEYLLYLPEKAREIRLKEIEGWFHETWFCWIGGYGDDDAFYYRIQSPVVIVEFDHHSGVFLTNKEPAKFHIHTLLRTPNGGDYGMALRPLMPGGVEQEYLWEGGDQ
ncbi:hypothetical protein QBC38DRAFT_405627 [Podospora fimiseda]|uniref:DUF3500 domain-containing protein n=1 Tax=Podospora fimiseda TaxID=252190 RepID=A0AAN7BZI1_9PEZI|nr:hypothetical protein QBC38DRAFT_405627 [Podospora fimiseda]